LEKLTDLDISRNRIEVDPKIKDKLPKLKKYDDRINSFNLYKEERRLKGSKQ